MMEPVGISGITEDYLIQPSRTLLGCIIETKGAPNTEPGVNLKMADVDREFDACSMSNISMQCMGISETGNYGEQLLPDQLLSFAMPKPQTEEKRDAEKTEDDPDQTSKNMYEGLLDKCNGEDSLLTSSNQDWGYIESFISESKMELLDLCSKNELSVNLFSEEDVDNYMFDDDDEDSTLSSDMCSLKIRYESFQDNMREKTNVLHEETQLNFFPSVLVNDSKTEENVVKSEDGVLDKAEDLALESDSKEEDDGFLERTSSPKVNYFIDSSNSADDSGEFGVDSSSSRSSFESFHESNHKNSFSRKNICSSSPLNYALREKRKVRYSDDYLYDVDSIENEKNQEKREQPPSGPREEQDDDWCPKKRKKSSRKEPPMIIKYIIINKFKGEKHTCVKLGKIDPEITTVSLNKDAITEYEKLAPLKDFWQQKQEEQLRLAAEDKHNFQHDRHRLLSSRPTSRKHKLANKLRIQRIQTVQRTDLKQESCPSDPVQDPGSEGNTTATAASLTTSATACASTLDPNGIAHTVTPKSRSEEMEEGQRENKILRMRKAKSEAGLRSEKMRDVEPGTDSVTEQTDASDGEKNKDMAAGGEETEINSDAHSPLSHTASEGNEKYAYMPTPCPSNEATSSDVDTSMPVIPGGYLQTLLDASDSLSGSGISLLSQQTSRQQSMGLSLEDQDFASLQIAQSCVLSPPSESELQQSPHNCPSLTQMWHSQLGSNQQFATDLPEQTILPSNFSNALPMPMSENLPVPEYTQLSLDGNRMLYEKNYLPERASPAEAEFQTCQVPRIENQLQFQRGALHDDNGRLISFDLVGSLSATPSNYQSLSLKSRNKDGDEGDVNENFLSHCSPKLVTQQSTEAVTPLRESTDLLDISNFTPDKFRHASLSAELSPPETPNLSPQVTGREMKTDEKPQVLQSGPEVTPEGGPEMKWYCDVMEQQDNLGGFAVDNRQYQLHNFTNDNQLEKDVNKSEFEPAVNIINRDAKVSKSKRKNGAKQAAGQTQRKSKATKPKASKGDKVKAPRQNSRASKKLKALLDEKSGKAQIGDSAQLTNSSSEDWPGMGFSENNSQTDYQQEFEEPSNILSNIVSGMAEVQRFMMASIEPTWGPAANISLPSESNSLSLKTLKILAGTASDPKKKGASSAGGTKARKGGGQGGKNQAKFNPLFPQLPLGCNMFEKSGLGVPGMNGPAHKKMYRHKTSAKFPRIENFKGKQTENQSDIELMASFEKLR
ncbi:neurite extension and migration factor [Trichomycterus rosablanca]|uniref:neurite extension and migration factor n=1 Tax=Trichomycterus rosablanca TaxID=2290929 RepID=UPI002F353D59